MKKVLLALFVLISFGSCRQNECIKYVKMGGQVIKEAMPATGDAGSHLHLPQQKPVNTIELSLLNPMESMTDRMTR
jgi:hypothetical protein